MTDPSNIPAMEMSGNEVFQYFFLHNPVPMWLFDVDTLLFLEVNHAAAAAYGYSVAEFRSMTIKDIRPAGDAARLEEDVKTGRAAGAFRSNSHWRHLKKDGTALWANITSLPVLYAGRAARLITANDITQSVEQSLALSKANQELEKLSLVAKLTGNSVMILDTQRQIIWVNDAFTAMTGFSLPEAAGKKPSGLLHGPRSSLETTRRIQQAIDRKKPFTEEIVHYTKTGKQRWILADGQPVPRRDDSPAEYIIVETDITELKEKETAVQASERQMNAFFEGTASLHILCDTALNIVTFNKVAEDFAERSLGRNISAGQSMLAVVAESQRPRFLHFASEALGGRATINREAEIELGNGKDPLWWVISDIPAYDSFGNIMGVAFTAFDITERKMSEVRIKAQNKALKDIAWRQSHLVRVPLTNIMSLTCLLQTEGRDQELLFALEHESKKLDAVITAIVYKTMEVRQG